MENRPKFTFDYIRSNEYRPQYVNGALGHVAPTEEIVIDFYLERNRLPESQTHDVTEEGKLTDKIDEKPAFDPENVHLNRIIQCGIVINLDTAKKIKDFLEKQIETLEKRIGGSGKKK